MSVVTRLFFSVGTVDQASLRILLWVELLEECLPLLRN